MERDGKGYQLDGGRPQGRVGEEGERIWELASDDGFLVAS